jgi:hypothetical protein
LNSSDIGHPSNSPSETWSGSGCITTKAQRALLAIRWSRLLAKINLDFPNNLNKPQQDY